ncbi:hypothetical protein [Pseudochelatococcus contaminans]|uniref:Glycosyltransferase RgtA/B/C/D-like domain-containing protein n=1 Tax=Pseudochelatococcus contaminans TaxID=1538103 RepID=A0A7W5Z2P2_9HYPH|nr:hypothetical protein [Pseudochelatococcus contaminans]MBB3808903.1 hypothetical protein [Pseudochelatococcus contaminans]
MNAVNKIEKFIYESAAWKFILVIGLLTLFKTGIWYIPNLSTTQSIAQNPFASPFSEYSTDHYLFWSWLGPFVAWLIGATGKWQFFAFHLAFSVAFTLLFIRIAFTNFSNELARSSLVLFSVLPVSATAYFWVSTDSITLFLMLLALAFPNSLLLTFSLGILLGMQHFEQGFFAAAGLLFAVTISHKQGYLLKYSWKFCLSLLIGTILGKIILIGLFKYYSIDIESGRLDWLLRNINLLLSYFFFHFHYIIWSVLGLGWLVAIRFMDWGHKSVPFFLTLAGLCLLLPVSGDQTRVLAIITFPLVSAYWLFNQDFLEKITRREISMLFIAWVLVPWGWVWDGIPRWSAFPYDVAYVLHRLFGWFDVPMDPALWPFR